jgi:chaperone BCS1
MAAHSSETLSEVLPSVLELLIPGFSISTRILSLYSRVDVSTCSSYVLLFTLLSAFFKFAIPQLYNSLQQLILYFAASVDTKFESSLHDPLIKWASGNAQMKKCR